MEILNQRINVKAVKAYQTVEMEMTVSNATNEEIAQVKAYLLNEAKIAVESLARDIESGSQPKPVAQIQTNRPVQQTQYQAPRVNQSVQNQGFNPQPRQQYQTNAPRKASEKQINYLRSFGWNGDPNISWDQANQLLQQYKQANGIQ